MKKLMWGIAFLFSFLFILYSVIFTYNFLHITEHHEETVTFSSIEDTTKRVKRALASLNKEDISNQTEAWINAKAILALCVDNQEQVTILTLDNQLVTREGDVELTPFSEQMNTGNTEGSSSATDQPVLLYDKDHRRVYGYSTAVKNEAGAVIANVQVLHSMIKPLTQYRPLILGASVSAVGVIFSLCGGMYYYYLRRVTLPMQSITKVVDHLSKDDYTYRYHRRGVAEFDEIGAEINELAENLNDQDTQLSIQESRLNLLIDSLVVGVILIDESGYIRISNDAAYRILNGERRMDGQLYQRVIKGYRIIQMVERSFKEQRTIKEEVNVYYPEEAILDVTVIYIDQKENDIQFGDQVIILIYDITEIRHLEKVRSDFIANASHELKTPVTALKGFSETLLNGALEDYDVAVEFVTIMAKESQRLVNLISDILDLADIEQGQSQPKIEVVDVNEVISEILAQLKSSAEEKQITLHNEGDHALCQLFKSNRGYLNQILTNLISNAIKYNEVGGDVWVNAVFTNDNSSLILTVQDNGIGIPSDDLPRIFERFYRVDKGRSQRTGGTGLGLSIVRNVVEKMGGHISVESNLRKGTIFTVVLPQNSSFLG